MSLLKEQELQKILPISGPSLEEVKKIKENLLAYCKMDTLAMVKILEVLKQL